MLLLLSLLAGCGYNISNVDERRTGCDAEEGQTSSKPCQRDLAALETATKAGFAALSGFVAKAKDRLPTEVYRTPERGLSYTSREPSAGICSLQYYCDSGRIEYKQSQTHAIPELTLYDRSLNPDMVSVYNLTRMGESTQHRLVLSLEEAPQDVLDHMRERCSDFPITSFAEEQERTSDLLIQTDRNRLTPASYHCVQEATTDAESIRAAINACDFELTRWSQTIAPQLFSSSSTCERSQPTFRQIDSSVFVLESETCTGTPLTAFDRYVSSQASNAE